MPIARLGDSLNGPGAPNDVFLIFRESQILRWIEEEEMHMRSLEVLLEQRNA